MWEKVIVAGSYPQRTSLKPSTVWCCKLKSKSQGTCLGGGGGLRGHNRSLDYTKLQQELEGIIWWQTGYLSPFNPPVAPAAAGGVLYFAPG